MILRRFNYCLRKINTKLMHNLESFFAKVYIKNIFKGKNLGELLWWIT